MIEAIIFWTFAIVSVLCAVGVVIHRSIIYSALMLIVVFLSIAAFFILNNADFLAVAQVIVYAVGMTIILLFGIMFTGEHLKLQQTLSPRRLLAYGIVGMFALSIFLLGVGFYPYQIVETPPEVIRQLQQFGSTPALGMLLYSKYLLPFELVSVLLLMAMIGAIVLAKKKFTDMPESSLEFPVATSSQPRPEASEWRKAVIGGRPSDIHSENKPAEDTVGAK